MKCLKCGGIGCYECDGTGEYEPFDADVELDKLDEVLGEFPMPEAKLVSITPNYKELLLLACSKPYGKNVSLNGLKHIGIPVDALLKIFLCHLSQSIKIPAGNLFVSVRRISLH